MATERRSERRRDSWLPPRKAGDMNSRPRFDQELSHVVCLPQLQGGKERGKGGKGRGGGTSGGACEGGLLLRLGGEERKVPSG